MSDLHNDGGHGDSIAAWTSVTIIMVAFAIGTAGVWFGAEGAAWGEPAVWGSVVLAAIGIIAGPVMSKLGFGVHGNKSNS